jgi:NFU1 iron-sulfur cluster scaffold homolog, mitochondrial
MATANTEMAKIEAIVSRTIRPALQGDGGDLELVDFKDNNPSIRYQGPCHGCPGALMGTLRAIEGVLKREYSKDIKVTVAQD